MLKIIFKIVMIIAITGCVNNNKKGEKLFKEYEALGDSVIHQVQDTYANNLSLFIELNDSAVMFYNKARCYKKSAQCYQDITFAYADRLENYEEGYVYAKKSVQNWLAAGDTLKAANIQKYVGLICSYIHKPEEGKLFINEAIKGFEKSGFSAGVAVSFYDLAKIYESENKYDSCIYYLNKNKVYFENKKDTSRVFYANNSLIVNLLHVDEIQEAGALVRRNNELKVAKKINNAARQEYYQSCYEYYSKIHNKTKADEFLIKSKNS